MSSKMLGKLETVFSYTAHFILQSWPEKRPGILFLTDSGGRVINIIEMQVGQSWNPQELELRKDSPPIGELNDYVMESIRTSQIVVKVSSEDSLVYGAFPLHEQDGEIRAVVGMVIPRAEIDFDLTSYMRGLEPLIRMGYDAYIQHVTSQIVMDLTLHDTTRELLESLTGQISEIIQKGYCSAVKLSKMAY